MKKLIIILAAAAMTGCGIYKPYTRPEVKTDGLLKIFFFSLYFIIIISSTYLSECNIFR